MNRPTAIRRLLAIFVIAGLAFAPLSRPVMAGMPSDASMAAMADDMAMPATADEMASGMPCCPAKAPAPVDCDKCVFMAACMTKCFTGLSAAVFHLPFAAAGEAAPLQNDRRADGLIGAPPDHPPRILT